MYICRNKTGFMKTKDLQERLEICQHLTCILKTADVRIQSYTDYLEGKNISPREYEKTRKQIESAELARGRVQQRISRILMGMYADLTPMDEVYVECTAKARSIEHHGYFEQNMWFEQNTES